MEFLSTLILAGLFLALLLMISLKSRGKHNLPPGPSGYPLVGNLPQLDKRSPFKSLQKLSETYGPVMTVHLGLRRVVVLFGYDAVKEALVDQADDFTGRAAIPFFFKPTRGYGLFISNGERWRQLRRFTLTTLRDFGMGRKDSEEWIQEESRQLIERIENTKGLPFEPAFFLSCSVSNVICGLVFGQRFRYQDDNFLRLLTITSEFIKFGSSPLGELYNIFPWLMDCLPGRHHTVFSQAEEVMAFVSKKIQEHSENINPAAPRDYIDCFLNRIEKEKESGVSEFHNDNLVSTVLNLFLAGTETTSITLRYALAMLMKYPDIQERVHQEIDTVIGQERSPNMEDRKSLPFTDAVIHEMQRFMDVAPFNVPHYTLKDISFRGYNIPKDTLILPMLHSVLKDKSQWDAPWSFDPKHFLDQNGNFKTNPAFLPFSAGKRACVGESLARMEIFIFLVSLLQHFTFSSPGGPDSIVLTPEYSGFFNLPHRYQLIATPR
ncbi:cytochrome P450 2F3-like [Aplochiton taeniatus]